MEINLSGEIIQQEFDKIDEMLPTLRKEGLLTEIECRLIASSSRLWEKRGAVYTVIMSKPEVEAVILTKAFRKMTEDIHTKQNTISLSNTSSNESKNCFILASKNPFLNTIIIKHLFGFLPLQDMKKSRLVCRQWNSTAEICLRKRSTIHFHPKILLPRTFMEVSKYSHPDLPFSSFAFSSDESTRFSIRDMQDFFEKWRNNITEVTFNSLKFVTICKAPIVNITPLFLSPSYITSLTIKTTLKYSEGQPRLNICLEEFVSIKTLSLSDCTIFAENPSTAIIAPHIINFKNISVMRNKEFVTSFYYNNFVDFSKAVNISLNQNDASSACFDLSKQILNLNQFHSVNVEIKNWDDAKGSVEFLRLYGAPFERNHLKIKLLDLSDSDIDLTALPQTLEILNMAVEITDIICSEALSLPNLKSLCIDMKKKDCLAYFSNCANLVSLQICNDYPSYPPAPCVFNLGNVPRSVRRMRMELASILEFTDNFIFQLDSLILSGSHRSGSDLKNFKVITGQIKSKVLVVVCHEEALIETSDIVELVLANKQSEKILIGFKSDLHNITSFERSRLSKHVDKKSNYYQFENSVGKSITEEEFGRFATQDICFPSYFNGSRF